MKNLIIYTLCLLSITETKAQNVGISNIGATPHASAMLDVASTTKGLLIPRVTTAQRLAINNNTADATIAGLQVYDLTTKTFWYHDGTYWVQASNNPDPSLGAISIFPYSSMPSDYLECNGSAVSRTTYAALFTKIGVTYGVGDGSTTFNLPDLRGEFVRGWDNARGVDAGRVMGSNQIDDFKSHNHTYTASNSRISAYVGGGSGNPFFFDYTANTSNTGGTETRPRNVAMIYAIKAIPTTVTYGSNTTDAQTLSITGSTLTISNGNSVVLPVVPAGLVQHFANITAPAGYLECNGQAVSRTTYAALFTAIGTLYGAGDGSTTFNVPDLRGEFIRGADNGRGVDASRVIGSAQTDAFQGHWHSLYTDGLTGVTGGSGRYADGGSVGPYNTSVRNPISDGANGVPRTTTETRPRNIAMMPCIKF
jgi:microcystin-dependent protein